MDFTGPSSADKTDTTLRSAPKRAMGSGCFATLKKYFRRVLTDRDQRIASRRLRRNWIIPNQMPASLRCNNPRAEKNPGEIALQTGLDAAPAVADACIGPNFFALRDYHGDQ